LSQYWKAWTKVIERIRPDHVDDHDGGDHQRTDPDRNSQKDFQVRPAPWYCGTRYSTQMTTTTSMATVRAGADPSRNSAKSGTV
jgi:hypothetical protein